MALKPTINRNNLKQTPIPVVSRTMPIVNTDGTVTRSGQLLLEQLQQNTAMEGTHADRPDAGSVPDGTIYVESDRGVAYYNKGGTWYYLAGTMFGTISNPDQRPSDLGWESVGFDFRTNSSPAREFMWSGANPNGWIEITPIRYDTHANRLAASLPNLWWGMIWMETDRSEVVYQQQGNTWRYVTGVMWGTVSPDNRPTDLGTYDAGFTYRGTDQEREFIWSGSSWAETSPVLGWTNLTHPNVVTKVSSTAGTIMEGGITDASAANSGTVQISASGQVGIGKAPAYPLDVNGDVNSTGSFRVSGVPLNPGGQPQTPWASNINGASYQLQNVSAIGIGTSTPATALDTGTSITPIKIATYEASSGANCYGIGVAPGFLTFGAGINASSGTPQMVLATTGYLGLGMNPNYLLQLSADNAAKPSTNTWTIVSDVRTKRNINRFEGDINVIRKLDPIVAEYNGQAGTPEGGRVVSFDAEQLRQILPQAVSSVRGNLDGQETDILGINTHEIFFHMIRTIQQLDREIEELKAKASAA